MPAELMACLRPTTLAAIFVDVCGKDGCPPDNLQPVADACWKQGVALIGEVAFDSLVGEERGD